MQIVIIGNGVAGIEAALTVRNREPDWSITIISEESDHFFSRTALMWVCTGQLSHHCIEPYERDLYARMNFQRVRARAVDVDLEKKEVTLAGGRGVVSYDRLLIACGSAPRPGPWPGADRPGVGSFVTLQDLEWLEGELHGGPSRGGRPPRADAHLDSTTQDSPYRGRALMRDTRGGAPRHPVVIGGGLIGIEAVEVMVSAGLRPRFFIRDEWFWPIALDDAESMWISERMREHGVDVHLGENVEELSGDDAVQAIRTDQGEHACDLCVVAIGVVPNTGWLEGTGLELDRAGGIVADAHLRTSDPDVYAAGDCASVTWFNGWRRPEQLWYTGRDQGRVAGRSLLGDTAEYARGIWYNSAKLIDIEYTTVGLVNMNVEGGRQIAAAPEQNWYFEEQGAVRSTSRIVTCDGRVVGFNFLGRRWDHSVLIRWIEEHRSLEYVLGHLGEASFDTEFVPPLVIPRSAKEQSLQGPAHSKVAQPTAPPTV